MIFTVFNDTMQLLPQLWRLFRGTRRAKFLREKGEMRHDPVLRCGEKPVKTWPASRFRDHAARSVFGSSKGRIAHDVVGAAASGSGPGWLGPRPELWSAPQSRRSRRRPMLRRSQTAAIVVEGNRRVEADTIRSYFRPAPGERLDSYKIDQALKALYATGLFQDVRINQSGGRLIVTVVENPVINRVAFEGNKKIKDEQLVTEVQSKPAARCRVRPCSPTCSASPKSIGATAASMSASSRKSSSFRTTASIWCSRSTKATRPASRRSALSATTAYRDQRLKDEIRTSETYPFIGFLQSADIYDPDRIEADRDLIRRFYLKHGYADVRVVSAVSVYDPEAKGFIVTFTIEEGARYRFGKVEIQSNVAVVDPKTLYGRLRASSGSVYNAEAVEKSVENLVDRSGPARLSVCRGAAARRARSGHRHHPRGVRGRGRPARLHRAHQHPRQHPHPGLRHPARVRHRRGRRIQPRADRSCRAASEEPQLLQDRQNHQRAGLGARPHRAQCRR